MDDRERESGKSMLTARLDDNDDDVDNDDDNYDNIYVNVEVGNKL